MFVPSTCTAVQESSQVGYARRTAAELAAHTGLSSTEIGAVGVIVTELANNLVKYARHGQLLLRALKESEPTGIEILSMDQGPGMANVAQCLEDGYSSVGSAGQGLGAVLRMASKFDIFSRVGSGTVIMVQIWTGDVGGEYARREKPKLLIGAVSVPYPGEKVSGDGWSYAGHLASPRLALVDGLGHGPGAADAAAEALRVFEENPQQRATELLRRAHGTLARTRGAAMAIVEFDFENRLLCFTGVGNISGRVWGNTREHNFVSSHGIVGHEFRTVHEREYAWPPGATVTMCSDGLQTRLSLDAYPGLFFRHPALLAAVLYRDFKRERDDVTVVAVRE